MTLCLGTELQCAGMEVQEGAADRIGKGLLGLPIPPSVRVNSGVISATLGKMVARCESETSQGNREKVWGERERKEREEWLLHSGQYYSRLCSPG